MDFSKKDYQQVLDSYSVGKINESFSCGTIKVEESVLRQIIIRTNQGLFMLFYAHHDQVHELWWSSDPDKLMKQIKSGAGLKNANAVVIMGEQHFATHKFNSYFFLFQL